MQANQKRIRIGDLLVQTGAITEEQLQNALKIQKQSGSKIGETLIDLGYVTRDTLINVLVEQRGIEYIDLKRAVLDEAAVYMLNESMVKKYSLIPIGFSKENANVIQVAMEDPMDIVAMSDVAIITNMQVEPLLSTPEQIAAMIDRYFGKQQAMAAAQKYTAERQRDTDPAAAAALSDEVESSPIVQLVRTVMEQAIRQRASDIHVEPMETSVRIRFRIDGTLREVMDYDLNVYTAIAARIKIMAEMDISEKRKPQDGRLSIIVDKREYDVRVSMLPTVFGEKLVLRLTSKDGLTKDKSELGLAPKELELFNNILKSPHGIILVTGPTGSGKSTTLYTALSELNTEEVNIITVEDPVEANVDGINQVQVNPKADLTFASALRSILRQDPDIIMIGEIRDAETAEIAVKASITGHLVVSTLHTNSAIGSIVRLIDMGVEPYLIGDAMIGVIAQRLVRRLCECKRPRQATAEEKQILGMNPDEDVTIYRPGGCTLCNHTGYYGRVGIFEVIPISGRMRSKIAAKASGEELKRQAREEGALFLKDNATGFVLDGTTSIEEMIKITYEVDDNEELILGKGGAVQ